jgi:hypothetical protein
VAQDSSRPDFWDTRYRGGVTPWDAKGVPARLSAWLAKKRGRLDVLVPGCGSAYEVRAFDAAGHAVLAIDFSDAAVDAAQLELGALARLVRKADFFALAEGPFDVVYERAFLCALPRALWQSWGERMAALVRPAGELAGFFYFEENPKGPPFGIAAPALRALLEPAFALEEDQAVPPAQSIAVFAGKERWQVWRRKL